jgi:hypothetical protein
MSETNKKDYGYSYDKYKETVKRCVYKYQRENRPKLNEYMRNYFQDPEKKRKHYESVKRYRAKKREQKKKLKEEEERKRITQRYLIKKA